MPTSLSNERFCARISTLHGRYRAEYVIRTLFDESTVLFNTPTHYCPGLVDTQSQAMRVAISYAIFEGFSPTDIVWESEKTPPLRRGEMVGITNQT